jgi:hypothetical protein
MMKAAGFEASLREKDGTVAKEKWIAVSSWVLRCFLYNNPVYAMSMISSLRFRLRSKGVFIVFSQPQGKTPTVLFADFLSYLLLCARLHIADVEGQEIWNSVKENIDFILVIPNGWGNEEKEALRSAAIRGDLIPNHSNRLRFVKKGEATLHFGNHSDEQLSIWLKVLPAWHQFLIDI